jgi:hypothetical protein
MSMLDCSSLAAQDRFRQVAGIGVSYLEFE